MVAKEVYPNNISFSMNRNLFYAFLVVLVVAILILIGSFFADLFRLNVNSDIPFCGDGNFPGTCSINKPYYCSESGVLLQDATKCGCPESFSKSGGDCVSGFATSPKIVELEYIFEGERRTLDYVVYGGVYDYLSSLDQDIYYSGSEISSRADFKIDKIDEETQREFLLPLVKNIQNLASDKDDQARIAISIVQNIPYSESDETYSFFGEDLVYSRYPYQVLYEDEGICGEKTELLLFLLRELGYGVSFFYYGEENHEALGIKCPVENSFSGTGYCFIETTGPSIITDDDIDYVDIGKLTSSPDLFFISEGIDFGTEGFPEKRDANRLNRIRDSDFFGPLKKNSFDSLKEKYGLVDEYYGV